jgi:hypothetical protein
VQTGPRIAPAVAFPLIPNIPFFSPIRRLSEPEAGVKSKPGFRDQNSFA